MSVESEVDRSTGEKFSYFYQKIAKSDSKLYFIVIPGGPGGTSISSYRPDDFLDFREIQWGLPQGANVIYTDPRSRGCNSENSLDPETYDTINVANDILNIIKHERLTRYVLVGHSYGTVVATTLSQLATQQEWPSPEVVVLSGTLGHYFKEGNRSYGYERAWESLYLELPDKVQAQLPPTLLSTEADNFSYPFDLPADKWRSFIAGGLVEGGSYVAGEEFFPLKNKLIILNSEDASEKEELKSEVDSMEPESQLEESDFFKQIYCNELEENNEDCIDDYELTRPFDSANYSIASKILYFQGARDPATPLDQAFYHFENQPMADKLFVTLPIGGHSTAFMINDCKEPFWKKLLNNEFDQLKEILKTCPGNLKVTSGLDQVTQF